MPAVEDFPAVGQRALQAKQGAVAPNSDRSSEDRRKGGFFGRLSGLGRRPVETGRAPDNRDRELNSLQDQDAPLPVFFGRERR